MRAFPATRWSLVQRAGQAVAPELRRAALDDLLRRYLPALRARLVIELRMPLDAANDMLQSFVADRIVERDLIAFADEGKGRFRSFLLTALDRYQIDQYRAASAKKRAPSGKSTELPTELAGGYPPPSRAFDVAWAQEVLRSALDSMQAEATAMGRMDLWEVFRVRVLDPTLHGSVPVSYEQIAERLGGCTPTQAANALVTAKRMFARVLRSIVAEYCHDEADADREIQELRAVLGESH